MTHASHRSLAAEFADDEVPHPACPGANIPESFRSELTCLKMIAVSVRVWPASVGSSRSHSRIEVRVLLCLPRILPNLQTRVPILPMLPHSAPLANALTASHRRAMST